MLRIRTLMAAATMVALAGVAGAQVVSAPSASSALNVTKKETMGLSVTFPGVWPTATGVDISAGGTVNLGTVAINPSWDLKNNRTISVDAFFTQDLSDGTLPTPNIIAASNFSGANSVGGGAASTITWVGATATNAVVLNPAWTTGGTGVPRQVSPGNAAYQISLDVKLAVPPTAAPGTYNTTMTIRAYAN